VAEPPFAYRDGELHAELVPLSAIAAKFGTPTYVYSRAALERAYSEYEDAFAGRPHLVCYAMKANSNLAVLDLLARRGAGFDIVSGGELARVLAAGGDPAKVVFSGVGKSAREMAFALERGILCFNVESAPELERLDRIAAQTGRVAPVSIRVNPDVDARTHPYISTGLKENKFGVPFDDAMDLYLAAARARNLRIVGIDMHIGSQITELAPFIEATQKVGALVDRLAGQGIELHHIDLGGGVGIRYADEETIDLDQFAWGVQAALGERPQTLLFEPGRRLVGNAGLLLARVEYLKHTPSRDFAIVDAAMTELIRPALYDAFHEILPARPRGDAPRLYDVVGPVCESGDFLGRQRSLALAAGDLLAVMSAGAYGMVMASNYNSRPRACEVVVDGDAMHLVRSREKVEELFALERTIT
jgi:diaminopimelate decarboxylase